MACNGTTGNRGDTIFALNTFALAIGEPARLRRPGWLSPAWPARRTLTRSAG
jgi:hypothetical protein